MSRIRADKLVNRAGTGAPELPFGLNAPGGLNVTGIVTATSFQGDGSALTGVGDPSALKDGSNTKVQATSTGANVTGNVAATGNVSGVNVSASGNVSGVNVSASGNVTAVDGTFSGNAIVQGNLTVNGTTTTIDTAVTAVDSLAVDGNVTALGTLGIGTDTPDCKLEISNDGYAFPSPAGSSHFRVGNGGGSATIDIAAANTQISGLYFSDTDATARGVIGYHHNGNYLYFGTNDGTERLRITSDGDILPGADNTQDLGSSAKRFANIYTGDLNLSNEGSANDVDGTWGNYTIQEGEDDLFLINKRTGKKYKFNLTEVD